MINLVGNTYWKMENDWRPKMFIFWFLRAKAKGFSIEPFSPEGSFEQLKEMEKAWIDERNRKIATHMALLDSREAVIGQEDWDELKIWLGNNAINSIDTNEWDPIEGAPTLSQIIGWELNEFLEYVEAFDLVPDEIEYDKNDPDWETNRDADKAILEGKLLDDLLEQRSLILGSDSPQEYFKKIWGIWNSEDWQAVSASDKIVELFLKVANKMEIFDVHLSHLPGDMVLGVLACLGNSSKKHYLRISSEDFFVKQIVFTLRYVAYENLIITNNQDQDSSSEIKRALFSSGPLVKSGKNEVESVVDRVNAYNLVCLSYPQGTQVIDKSLRENFVSKTGLQWVISSFPEYCFPLEVYWKAHQNLPQWLFFNKDYKGTTINFFNCTSWNDQGGVDGANYYLFGLLERMDVEFPFPLEGASRQFPDQCPSLYLEERGAPWRHGITYINYWGQYTSDFLKELGQGRVIDNLLIKRLGANWIKSSEIQLQDMLNNVVKDEDFLTNALNVCDPDFLPSEAVVILNKIRKDGKGSVSLDEVELLNCVYLSFFYPTGILTVDFWWRCLSIPKKFILKNEAVFKQYFWQKEVNRNFENNDGNRNFVDNYVDSAISIRLLDGKEIIKSSSGNLPVVNATVLRSDSWGIDFDKIKHFVDSAKVSADRIISEPAVLGFKGHRGFPVWFEYFDPQISPYKSIYLSDQTFVIRPLNGDSVRMLWDSLAHSLSHADGWHWFENWWVLTELTDKNKWLKELYNLELVSDEYPFANGNVQWFANFEVKRDLIALFLQKFEIKSNREETFKAFYSFLREALKPAPDEDLPESSILWSFDREKVASDFLLSSPDDEMTYQIKDKDNVILLIRNNSQIVGAVKVKASKIGLKVQEVSNYAELASFVYKVWQESTNTIIELSGASIAHETTTPYSNIKTTLHNVSIYLKEQRSDNSVSNLKKQIKGCLTGLGKLERLSENAKQFQKRKAKGQLDNVNVMAIIRAIARRRKMEIEGGLLSDDIFINTYQFPLEMALNFIINNAFGNSCDSSCQVRLIKQENGDLQLKISNYVKPDFKPDIVNKYGREPLRSTTGGNGIGALVACRFIDTLGADWHVSYNKDNHRFAVELLLKGA